MGRSITEFTACLSQSCKVEGLTLVNDTATLPYKSLPSTRDQGQQIKNDVVRHALLFVSLILDATVVTSKSDNFNLQEERDIPDTTITILLTFPASWSSVY